MNLKAVVAADQSPDHFRGRATSITAAAASPAVAPPEWPEPSDAELSISRSSLKNGFRHRGRNDCRGPPTVADWSGGPALASPAHGTAGGEFLRRKNAQFRQDWSSNMATPFIDHSSEMWDFCRYGLLYPLSCSIRKVTP
jgi:hypothetical protein